jgi:hypothetical protein
MADTYYAWNTFRVPNADTPGDRRSDKVINVGDKISPSDLGLDADSPDWQAYVDNQAVRTYEHPDMGDFTGSPVELRKAQLAALAEGGTYDSQFGRVMSEGEVPNPESGKEPEVKQQANTPANQ